MSRAVRRPAGPPQKMVHRGGSNAQPQPNQLWFLEVSQPLQPWPGTPAEAQARANALEARAPPNPDAEKHYFLVNAMGKHHVPRAAPSAPIEDKWGRRSPRAPVPEEQAQLVPAPSEETAPGAEDAVPSAAGPARKSPSPTGSFHRDPSSLPVTGTPRSRKLDPTDPVGPLGPGRFERWKGGASPRSVRADRGRLPMPTVPAPAMVPPPANGRTELATAAAAAGVVPAIAPPSVLEGTSYQSAAVRLAVTVAEQLETAERAAAGAPSAGSVATCLRILTEMAPLLGPLEAVTELSHL